MQYTIEIGRNCNFQVSQGSAATQLSCNSSIEFHWESESERISKIGLHLPKF